MKWVTRERPKIDRIACPRLIERFIDKEAEFLSCLLTMGSRCTRETGAIPFDVEGVELSTTAALQFRRFIESISCQILALRRPCAQIVRGADTIT